MNRDLALTNPDSGWPIQPYDSTANSRPHHFAPSLDFPTIIRILSEWTAAISAIFAASIATMAQNLRSAPVTKKGEFRPTRHVKLG